MANTKSKNYISLKITASSVNYQELSGCYSCSNILLRDAYPNFRICDDGNVTDQPFSILYNNNDYLKPSDFITLNTYIKSQYFDAITFIIPDPREILHNYQYWYSILNSLPVYFKNKAYIIGYEGYFKVEHITESLNLVSSTPQKLPYTGIDQVDNTISDFNDYIYTSKRDFNADGSVVPENERY